MKRIIIFGTFVLILFIITILIIFIKPKPSVINDQNLIMSTPTGKYQNQEIFTPSKPQFKLLEVNPSPGSRDIDVSTVITFKFDKTLGSAKISADSVPNVLFQVEKNNNVVTISPKEALKSSTPYTFVVQIISNGKTELFDTDFYTIGPSLSPTPTVQPYDITNFLEQQKQDNPDVYLSNKVPFSNSYFSVDSTFVSSPTGHFQFKVTLKRDRDVAKQQFLSWVASQGLGQEQISKLDIIYL